MQIKDYIRHAAGYAVLALVLIYGGSWVLLGGVISGDVENMWFEIPTIMLVATATFMGSVMSIIKACSLLSNKHT
jgi:hypothetical protein